jgi:hypothetical protein
MLPILLGKVEPSYWILGTVSKGMDEIGLSTVVSAIAVMRHIFGSI